MQPYPTLLDADELEMQKDYEFQFFLLRHPRIFRLYNTYQAILYYFLYYGICKIKGHALVDNGYGGPESGCIAMSCTRCGHSWPINWLY